jgi:hypothetical protein
MRSLLLCSLLLLSGCGLFSSAPVMHPMADADSWDIAVVASKVAKTTPHLTSPTEGRGSISKDVPEMVITVPASAKPTVVEVRRAKRTIIDKTLTNKPVFEVKSDNPGVTAAQPKQTVWWKWIAAGIAGLLLVALVFVAVAQKVANFSVVGFFLKLFKRG